MRGADEEPGDGPAGNEEDQGPELPVDGPETVAEKRLLATLGRQARTVNLARVERLLTLLDGADECGLTEPERREAENLAHQLVGSAGTFGFPSASLEAVPIEDYFARRAATTTVGSDEVRATLVRLRGEFAG